MASNIFEYSEDISKRYVPADHTCGQADYLSAVDGAMRDPIRIMNEELKLKTFVCCEGHLEDQCSVHDYPNDCYGAFIIFFLPDWWNGNSFINYITERGYENIGCRYTKGYTPKDGIEYPDNIFAIDFRSERTDSETGIEYKIMFRLDSHIEPLVGLESRCQIWIQKPGEHTQSEWDIVRDNGLISAMELLKEYMNKNDDEKHEGRRRIWT
jgi:hypothetical protein